MYEQLMRGWKRELVQRVNALTRRMDDLTFPEKSPSLADPLLSLPALRGCWIGPVDPDGDWWDLSPFDHDLKNQGQVNLNLDGVVPYWTLDGSNDYFSITDAASGNRFDISGTETSIASAIQGLTAMLWFYPEETSTLEMLIAKWGAAASRAYRLYLDASDQVNMEFSDDGTNSDTATSSVLSAMNAWYYAAGRADFANNSVDVFVGSTTGLEEVNQATAQNSIFDTATNLNVGARAGGTEEFEGRVACAAICACACSDAIISSVFNRMRGAFGV